MNLEENTKLRTPLKFKFTNLPDTHPSVHIINPKPKDKIENQGRRLLKQMYQAPSRDQWLHDTTQQPIPDAENIIPMKQRYNNDR